MYSHISINIYYVLIWLYESVNYLYIIYIFLLLREVINIVFFYTNYNIINFWLTVLYIHMFVCSCILCSIYL